MSKRSSIKNQIFLPIIVVFFLSSVVIYFFISTQIKQNIIDKMTDKVKTLQQQNDQLIECKQTYEEMLQANRYTLKQLSIENRDKQTQIDKYKQILQSAIGDRHRR